TTKKAVVEPDTEATTKSVSVVFDDIASKPWAADAINNLAQLGIINGVGDGKFAPDASCKRADFAIILVNVLGLSGTATDNFDDVVAGKYYYNPVGLAKEAGVVNGYGDGNFGPEKFCTRAELMVMVANALKVAGKDITADESVLDKFSDKADIPAWARPYVAYLVNEGIVSGSNGKINPNVFITRAEVAVIMYNVYEMLEADKAVEEVVEETEDEEVVTTTIETTVDGYDENAYAGDSDAEAAELEQ
ncbi:MAG: S-layer homology domain-containing protein, partial [Firmicutes bacterium]|nr:S-layer homology domain-containing protein [Bacillota bacterium]